MLPGAVPEQPVGERLEPGRTTQEVLDQVGGVLASALGQDPVAVASGHLGVEQVVVVEG